MQQNHDELNKIIFFFKRRVYVHKQILSDLMSISVYNHSMKDSEVGCRTKVSRETILNNWILRGILFKGKQIIMRHLMKSVNSVDFGAFIAANRLAFNLKIQQR